MTIEFAVYSLILLNSETTVQFLQSITFTDAKRTFTKDVLMRIDLLELAKQIYKSTLQTELEMLNKKYGLNLTLNLWDNFINEMTPISNEQMAMFVLKVRMYREYRHLAKNRGNMLLRQFG